MGGKNAKARQARLQRKRNKRASARKDSAQRHTPGGGPPPGEMLVTASLLLVQCLLSGVPWSPEMWETAQLVREELGIIGRVPLELHAFLREGAPWTLTCAQIEPLRRLFPGEAFARLWSLALTSEPGLKTLATGGDGEDGLGPVAGAFEELRGCLDDPKRQPTRALRTITAELHDSVATERLTGAYGKLLRTAVASVHAGEAKRAALIDRLAAETARVFDLGAGEDADADGWWHCGRVFLREVVRRLQAVPGVPQMPAYAELVRRLLPAPEAAVELARCTGGGASLAAVQLSGTAREWSAYLTRAIDVGTLAFDERVRYELARLKLLRTQATAADRDDDSFVRELLAVFQQLTGLLSRGVPPQFRTIPAALSEPLTDFYVDTIETLRCEPAALRVTEGLRQTHPQDFRLACLYATGVVQDGDYGRLARLAGAGPWRHLDPELFARSVRAWLQAPRGAKAAGTLRAHLFDPLDREDRKQCLIALGRQTLRRATSLAEHGEELRHVLPFVPRDSFVFAELREKSALESSLVFLATLLAPLHSLKLALTDEQSQQWVSHAREIARQTPLGAELATRLIRSPKGFTLSPAVLSAARAQLQDFRPVTLQTARPPPPPPPRSRRRRKARKATSDQADIFDVLDP